MSRRCTVCDHPKREQIDRELVSQEAGYRDIAGRYGLTRMAVHRHAKEHLPEALLKAQDAKEVAHGDSLLEELTANKSLVAGLIDDAMADGDKDMMLRALREMRGYLELTGKLAGQLQEKAEVHIHLSTEWMQIQMALLEVLTPYPEAYEAVAGVIEKLDQGET